MYEIQVSVLELSTGLLYQFKLHQKYQVLSILIITVNVLVTWLMYYLQVKLHLYEVLHIFMDYIHPGAIFPCLLPSPSTGFHKINVT